MFIGNRLDGIQKSIGTSDIFIRVIRAVGTTVAVRKLLTNFHFAGQNTALQGTVGQYSFILFLAIGNDLFFNIRSEEHTSELQSRFDLVCRLLLEKKKT